MFRDSAILRGLILAGVCLPLALFIGYQLATPDEKSSLVWIGAVFGLLTVPFLIRWHHPLLIICWNLSIAVFFIPGTPAIGLVIAGVSLLISIVSRTVQKQKAFFFLHCPSVSFPLILLAVVVVITMAATGGLHSHALGSETWGASRYLWIMGGIIGYFALIAQPTPPSSAKLMAALFFLSGMTALIPVLLLLAGPSFQIFTPIFQPTGVAGTLVNTSYNLSGGELERFTGLFVMSQSFCWFMLARFGIRGLFDWHRPWRLVAFAGIFMIGLLAGFRSYIILMFFLFLVQFHFEKLYRSSLFWGFLAGGLLLCTFVVSYSDQLPLTVQRSISFVPMIKIDPVAQIDAMSTTDWRLEMWKVVLPLVPQYLLLGKGYSFDGTDYYLSTQALSHGLRSVYEGAMISNDYHNGFLTLIIPLGIFGFLAFAAFCWGSLRALYANYRYGDPELNRINTFLLAYFIARLVFYLTIYGEFHLDLMIFTGIIGLSLTLNGGVRSKKPAALQPMMQPKPKTLQFQPV
jgi:hypothetical protein